MLLVCIVFITLLLFNMPIAFTIGISSLVFFFTVPDLPIALSVQQMATGTQSFPLLAVPFFVLAGHILNASGITTRLIRFANALTGHLVGGLAHVSIVLSALMGGVSGSATADAAMQSRILAPQMIKRGYSGGYSVAAIAVSSLITSTLPPSIGLILYGFVGGVSIGKLFLAGIIPGILMTFLLMITAFVIAKKRGYDAQNIQQRPSFREVVISFKESFWALLFPIILIVGIRFGIFTASEGGAVAVVYALVVGKFIYRELNWAKLRESLTHAIQDNGMIMLIISTAAMLGYVIAYENVPQSTSQFITGISEHPLILLSVILLFVLVAGMFMEATANTLLLTPIFLPIIQQAGIDPIHFGIMMMILITMGGMTPPVGVTMFAVCSLTKIPVSEFVKESLPFLLAIIVLVVIIMFIPDLVLFIPDTFME